MTRLRVRPEEPADIAAIRIVLAEAFAPPAGQPAGQPTPLPAEVALVDALRDGPAWLPELSVVAEADGAVVAYALLSRVSVGDAGVPALALGPVAVRPAYQRSGFGSAVIRAGLDAAAELGERLVLVLGDPAFYGRFGFVPADGYGLTSPWSGPHYQAMVAPDAEAGAAVGADAYAGAGAGTTVGVGVGSGAVGVGGGAVGVGGGAAVPSGEVRYPRPWLDVS